MLSSSRAVRIVLCLVVVLVLFAVVLGPAAAQPPSRGLLPDLRTVIPKHLSIVNEHQQEILRFTNGIANTGDGPLRLRPERPAPGTVGTQAAVQEILDAGGNIVSEAVVSEFEFHEDHHHWHMVNFARFEVRIGSPTGPVLTAAPKVGLCVIDWYKLEDNSKTPERAYWDCEFSYQGISVGWVDQYNQAIPGQELDLTGAPVGRYYLVSVANPAGIFIETDTSNNLAWIGFDLVRDSQGNPKIVLTGEHSACDSPGLCGEQRVNR